ncbi:transglutaminase-like domain-containing protein [Actinomadura bangladeshensis]|uniref:Transglutaminase domain-containing protein n=1 Tax=Actinomadura bangladeshensis TaxID=453573 RepID=A0A4V2XL11_9ACTN|nr:transglutaminase domain-containing protein [Actinomadura bangladeshensis]TDC08616.1 transglutaminase domain-containing protein [Actinomadura bangladeshensis]
MPRSPSLAPAAADFYTAQSGFSSPGRHYRLYDDLPTDPARLAEITRGLMIHRVEGDLFAYDIPVHRLHDDAETRYLDDILTIITGRNPAPLTHPREPGDRFVGVCRDFALLLCSFLRHAGIPARLRSGFADYFGSDGFHVDHVVTEYWDDRHGWRLADAQLADTHLTTAHAVDFDPMDVPRDRFLVAGAALRLVGSGAADPRSFGIPLPDRLFAGEWFVVNNVRLDLAALNKVETLLWDVWGAAAGSDEDLTDDIRDLYHRLAFLTSDEVRFDAVRAAFTEDENLRTPQTVLSLAPFKGPRHVTLR